jgi:hypothetical protein
MNFWIGDNGSNGTIRTMLSLDPAINMPKDSHILDASPNHLHSFYPIALSHNRSDVPYVSYGKFDPLHLLADFKAIEGSLDPNNPITPIGDYTQIGTGDGGPIVVYEPPTIPPDSPTRYVSVDAGSLSNNISQYMKSREMELFSAGGTSEGTVEVSVICKQNVQMGLRRIRTVNKEPILKMANSN